MKSTSDIINSLRKDRERFKDDWSSLHQDLWFEILKHLSPSEMVKAIKMLAFMKLKSQSGLSKKIALPIEYLYHKALYQLSFPIVASTSSTFILNKGTIFACGNNQYGQLGLGDKKDRRKLTEIVTLRDKAITSMANGEDFSLFLSKSGKVYACGENLYGQLGIGDIEKRVQPIEVKFLKNETITCIAAGGYFSLFLSKTGKVYACGDNECGQLGFGEEEDELEPTEIIALENKEIISIAAGDDFSLFLSKSGKVYTCGENEYGQLGLGDEEKRHTPTEITTLKDQRLIAMAAGNQFSLFLSESGEVFACGHNDFGQLGLNDKKSRLIPTQITTLRGEIITAMSAGADFSLFLSKSGKVFACGNNYSGQLGLKDNKEGCLIPTEITALKGENIIAIAAGDDYSLFLSASGALWGCGNNQNGQLVALDFKKEERVPVPVMYLHETQHISKKLTLDLVACLQKRIDTINEYLDSKQPPFFRQYHNEQKALQKVITYFKSLVNGEAIEKLPPAEAVLLKKDNLLISYLMKLLGSKKAVNLLISFYTQDTELTPIIGHK
ncbi:Regulator of chromosome condensation, rcc (substrate of the Dot/Icm secretion system) [Legionella gratiana]|uniref:Regulator of chromosome condensation, rcc (Substrate of the Dot/Icm secretion system) n=1 Tax=Legionella gratiana TaxID=45066 RepID=A0A378JDY2_9GAMM|nr:hypothetical protein [Legionella gratiana]KTD06363.1 Regulator of chromosome condensation, rcc (substrate of the Dot/Icm secretion system) [Legionella gratiana]STX45181.1 Regulator of chromosome condensation, rcc (substrate of the Dot/Icm secretion system) [Legionella gratiana]